MASLTLEELTEELCGTDGTQGVLQDSSYYAGITTRINDVVTAIAAGIRMPSGIISPPLPDLFDTDTVTTSTTLPYVTLPTDYQRGLFMVADSNGDKIYPPQGGNYYSFALFMRQIDVKDLTESGDIHLVCVKGTKLYYQAISSSAKTLTLHFYRKPVDLDDDDDDVDGIPEHLQKRLIKHGVAREVFGEGLEDSDQSRQAGYNYHTTRFYEAMTDLIDFCGIDAEPEYYGTDDEDYQW